MGKKRNVKNEKEHISVVNIFDYDRVCDGCFNAIHCSSMSALEEGRWFTSLFHILLRLLYLCPRPSIV